MNFHVGLQLVQRFGTEIRNHRLVHVDLLTPLHSQCSYNVTCKIISRAFCMWHRKLLTGVKQIPGETKRVPRLSWLGCRCAHATASTKRMCQTPGSAVFFNAFDSIGNYWHSWPWSEAPTPPPGRRSVHVVPFLESPPFNSNSWKNCGHFLRFEMRRLHWWHWKQQVLRGRGWKMNQRRARNLYQITQMTFFRVICRTPWNMVDPLSAPQ